MLKETLEKGDRPSEVASSGTEWRSLMEAGCSVSAELVESRELLALQRGQPVHPLSAKEPNGFKSTLRTSAVKRFDDCKNSF